MACWRPPKRPRPSEQQDALQTLNGLIDLWGTFRLTMLSVARYEVNLVSGQQSYTIGDGGDFDLEPPLELDHVGLIYPGTTPPNEELLDLLTDDQYAAIQLKTMDNPLPQAAYYTRPTATLGILYFWPQPSQDLTVALYLPNAIVQFSSLNEEVTLAPAYYMALRFNLAALLYPEYGITPRGRRDQRSGGESGGAQAREYPPVGYESRSGADGLSRAL